MAKREVDRMVASLLGIKDIVSSLKGSTEVIAVDPNLPIIYMYTHDSIQDSFIMITDDETKESAKTFSYHLINIVEAVAFNKALKKTKTVSDIKDDKSIYYSTEGYEVDLTLPQLSDYAQFTSKYHKLFKDSEFTQKCLNPDLSEYPFISVSDSSMLRLYKNKLVCLNSNTGNQMYVSKGLFGNVKKTIGIEYKVIESNDYDEVVLFRQHEPTHIIYRVVRFLKVNE